MRYEKKEGWNKKEGVMQGFLLYKRRKSRTDEPKLSLSLSLSRRPP
jgi:hypothetical protein